MRLQREESSLLQRINDDQREMLIDKWLGPEPDIVRSLQVGYLK